MREWIVAVVPCGGENTKIESFAHWHMGQEMISVREVCKPTIEEIAEKFRVDVLPHITDLLENDNGNQFEGYVFAYIMAHHGWDWSNARDAEFLSMFSSR